MASLHVRTPDGKVRTVPLLKRITSVGRGPDNDVSLDDPAVPESALHVLFDGSRYQVGSLGATFQINGKKRDSHVLASQDVIRVGGTELTFSRDDAAPVTRPVGSGWDDRAHVRRPRRRVRTGPRGRSSAAPRPRRAGRRRRPAARHR